jgi:hypothetical protein
MLWWAGPLNVHVVRQTITTIVNRGSFPKKKSQSWFYTILKKKKSWFSKKKIVSSWWHHAERSNSRSHTYRHAAPVHEETFATDSRDV